MKLLSACLLAAACAPAQARQSLGLHTTPLHCSEPTALRSNVAPDAEEFAILIKYHHIPISRSEHDIRFFVER